MKRKFVVTLTAFMFAFVAVGAWDCGCAFASIEQKPTSPPQEKVMHCHSEAKEQTKSQEKETCCPGCQLEKANNNSFSSIEAISLTNQKAFGSESKIYKTLISSFIEINKNESMRSRSFQGRSASIHVSNPIYILVQSFLI